MKKDEQQNVLHIAKLLASIIGSTETEIMDAFQAFSVDIKNEKEA
jgi:hypothetical protein